MLRTAVSDRDVLIRGHPDCNAGHRVGWGQSTGRLPFTRSVKGKPGVYQSRERQRPDNPSRDREGADDPNPESRRVGNGLVAGKGVLPGGQVA
jgi:hypothetical protein